MRKAELEERVEQLESEVDMLRKLDRQRMAEDYKADVWRYEVLRMLRRRGIEDCTDRFFGYERLVGDRLETILKDASFKAISKNECEKRTFYKAIFSDYAIYGYIDRGNPGHTFSATVFASPPGKKQFKCVLCFTDFKTSIAARLGLAILMVMMDRNECGITRFHSESLKEFVMKESQEIGFVLGTYASLDDKYHYAVIASPNYDGTVTYNTYYFKRKGRSNVMVGMDVDFSDMVRALACLSSSAKEAAGDLTVENDEDYMFDDLFDYFG
ncbi:MAG: hypothetical protein NC453_22110 [Muribaculum sp.]|nr:hypothetical protein [Muribaculum sp.]